MYPLCRLATRLHLYILLFWAIINNDKQNVWYLHNYLCCVAESIPDFRKFCFDQALLWPKSSVYSLTCLIRTVFHWLASGSAHLTSRVFSGAHPLPVLSATGHPPVTIKPLLGTRTNAQWVSKRHGDVSRNHSYTSAGGNWFIPRCSIWEPHTYLSVNPTGCIPSTASPWLDGKNTLGHFSNEEVRWEWWFFFLNHKIFLKTFKFYQNVWPCKHIDSVPIKHTHTHTHPFLFPASPWKWLSSFPPLWFFK